MKLTAILLLIGCLQVSANSHSQTITLSEKNAPLKKIFMEIKAQSGYTFVYRDEWLKLAKNVDLNLRNVNIRQALDACFKGQPLTYTIIKTAVVIRLLEKKEVLDQTGDSLDAPPPIDIKGRVTDAEGKPLEGVSVTVKGSAWGTKTDASGYFVLNGIEEKNVLIFSIVGYQSQETIVGKQEELNIKLIVVQEVLDDVVVIGYGSVRKADLTGAVSSVKQSDIGNVVTSDVGSMIQGRVAGVNVVNANGVPGAGSKILVRGTGTLYNADPLYIIDGMPGSFSAINTYDIESIEVLKDAASTAIYGARAANGVVLVTTKKGKTGPLRVTLNAYAGIAQTPRKLPMLNASQYIDLAVETDPAFWSKAKRFMPVSDGGLGYTEEWARTSRNDIQNVLFKNAPQQEYHINLSGGSPNINYSFSLNYRNQDAIIKGFNHQRLNILSNIEYKYRSIFKIGNNMSYARIEDNGIPFTGYAASLMSALNYAPYMDLYDADNSWGYSQMSNALDAGSSFNPLPEIFTRQRISKTGVLQNQVYGEVNIYDGLRFRSQLIYTQSSPFYQEWYPTYAQGGLQYPAQITKNISWSQSSTWENYFSYDKSLGKHHISAMAGMSGSKATFNNSYGMGGIGTSSPDLPWENYNVLMISQTPTSSVTGEAVSHYAYLSYFGRINYSFLNRYLLTLNYRQDASPNFAPENRWGRFPSAAFAWKVNEEAFFSNIQQVNQLKLRLSWGLSGNDRIPNYGYLSTLFKGYNSAGFPNGVGAAFGLPGTWIQGTTSNALASVGIKWEDSEAYNIGIDLGMWQNKFTASLDLYIRNTNNILVQVPINPSAGIDVAPFSNAASVRNRGFDLSLGYNEHIGKNFRFSLSGVIGYVTNKVTSLGTGEPIWNAPLESSEFITLTTIDNPIGSFYGYKMDKVLSTTAEAEVYNTKYGLSAAAGDIAFKDIAGPKDADGKPTGPDGKIDDNDRTFIGSPIPKFNYGFNISAYYKKFDLNIGGTGIAGVQIYDFFSHTIRTTERLKRWRQEGDITDVPRAVSGDNNRNGRVSDRFVTDGSFLKIRNITLGYTIIPKDFSDYIDNCRIYITVQNALCFTGYKSFDPELGSMNANGGGNEANYNLQRGIAGQYNNFPNPRIFMLGVSLSFK
ncbi:TonB-dependent receptor [Terrimonas sp.]|uniref:TonB-dependent receptor n=1 Tax=Terrimonas sp. TaxID=1914338 RepID=UPI0014024EDB|nr:TonB-dependent receptor [Terrimonas sp.]